ncbi:3-hydroxyacyl-CoA dehydrogenase NAD-binding domain-containing protein [Parapedobacter indicus]|uniref:3-hydroxybutyryl-CoA dehydrogenase n=1 Tax=Parapedobacter indicus TaxID=1477437 RepID=A0A1I3GVD5_9SPHI|nr:3-hydroxyacyl-CoA dehydrogenase NAD-binding domain-containing protein [Parapedobacter indicus]PPL02794.1 3-hydroxybutyryl-CoA dehydrogenase [Parapedobacter indicus]SFI27347.1 3-hydroxybutyryl-CoA dehydrogenase [Parapedobacter indicus]
MAQMMMKETNRPLPPLLIVGDGKLAYSVAGNALRADQETTLLTSDVKAAYSAVKQAMPDRVKKLILPKAWPTVLSHHWIVVITEERSDIKRQLIERLEGCVGKDAVIAVNTESIPLAELQAASRYPERILGLNWCYPADLTFFLEIICNEKSASNQIRALEAMAKNGWNKDPYLVKSGFSVRARMMAAWAREAFYLVENGYASIESIDRACRNDAGYYLPFAGNFRYMDLMGTYAYGVVMKDLNPELSQATVLPDSVVADFQDYAADHPERWEKIVRTFSEEIRELILKYPHET